METGGAVLQKMLLYRLYQDLQLPVWIPILVDLPRSISPMEFDLSLLWPALSTTMFTCSRASVLMELILFNLKANAQSLDEKLNGVRSNQGSWTPESHWKLPTRFQLGTGLYCSKYIARGFGNGFLFNTWLALWWLQWTDPFWMDSDAAQPHCRGWNS